MVKREEIERLGDLIKIELKDPEKYIKQVEQIINYFASLDKVGILSDDILANELPLDKLRDDKPENVNNEGLIDNSKKDRNNFVKAPKMI